MFGRAILELLVNLAGASAGETTVVCQASVAEGAGFPFSDRAAFRWDFLKCDLCEVVVSPWAILGSLFMVRKREKEWYTCAFTDCS